MRTYEDFCHHIYRQETAIRSENINCYFDKRSNLLKNRSILELLDGLLNYKLVNLILKKNRIDSNKLYSELTNLEKNKLFDDLVKFKLEIIDNKGFGIRSKKLDINENKLKIPSVMILIVPINDDNSSANPKKPSLIKGIFFNITSKKELTAGINLLPTSFIIFVNGRFI